MPWDAGTVVITIDARGREIKGTAPSQRCYGMLSMPFQKENNRKIWKNGECYGRPREPLKKIPKKSLSFRAYPLHHLILKIHQGFSSPYIRGFRLWRDLYSALRYSVVAEYKFGLARCFQTFWTGFQLIFYAKFAKIMKRPVLWNAFIFHLIQITQPVMKWKGFAWVFLFRFKGGMSNSEFASFNRKEN